MLDWTLPRIFSNSWLRSIKYFHRFGISSYLLALRPKKAILGMRLSGFIFGACANIQKEHLLVSISFDTGELSNWIIECAYGLRYVELNRRKPMEQPDHDPWSVRQSAVYQQYNSRTDRIMFILISPSNVVREAFIKELEKAAQSGKTLHSFDLHRILVTLLHSNWREYVRSLEKLMGDQVSLQRANDCKKLIAIVWSRGFGTSWTGGRQTVSTRWFRHQLHRPSKIKNDGR